MKHMLSKIPGFFKNFYFIASVLFVMWLLFFDSNDLVTQVKLSNKQSELLETKLFYEEKIQEVKRDREALLNNQELLEKMAREKYFMKKENEDVFVIVEK